MNTVHITGRIHDLAQGSMANAEVTTASLRFSTLDAAVIRLVCQGQQLNPFKENDDVELTGRLGVWEGAVILNVDTCQNWTRKRR